MNHDKVQEITAEMRTLLNQQTLVMSNPATIRIVETPQPKWTHIKQETIASANLARN
jgi:hypothetical protein